VTSRLQQAAGSRTSAGSRVSFSSSSKMSAMLTDNYRVLTELIGCLPAVYNEHLFNREARRSQPRAFRIRKHPT
jgi:predicted transcriptional regulator